MSRLYLPYSLTVCAALSIFVAACDETTPDEPPGISTYREFQHAVDAARCESRFRCCMIEGATEKDEESCVKAFDDAYDELYGWVDEEGEAGTIIFDPQVAARCAAASAQQNANCAAPYDISILLTACAGLLHGTLPLGADCNLTEDRCAYAYCHPIDDTYGTCKEFAQSGDSCSAKCSPDLVCLPSGSCGPLAQPGEACDGFLQCSTLACNESKCVALTVREEICL